LHTENTQRKEATAYFIIRAFQRIKYSYRIKSCHEYYYLFANSKNCKSIVVNEYAQLLLTSIKQGVSQANPPSKVTLEFGLQVGGETGIPLVTKGSAQANIKVAIEWQFNQDKGG